MKRIFFLLALFSILSSGKLSAQYVLTRTFGVDDLKHDEYVFAVAFSPDGTLIASGVGEDIFLWDAVTGKRRRVISKLSYGTGALDFSPDGRLLVLEDTC